MRLEVCDLEAGYGPVSVLRGVSMRVEPGEIVAVVGANGAGKTTLLRVISGLLRPRAGRVFFDGQEITGWPPERIVALGLVHIPERRQLFAAMSVEDNLRLGAYLRWRRGERRAVEADLERIYALFPRLKERRRQLAGTLSGGGAADAGHRAGTDGPAPPPLAGRTLPGPGPAVGPGAVPGDRWAAGPGDHHAAGGAERPAGPPGG